MNADVPDDSRERIAEIGEILAAGLVRLRARKSSEFSRQIGESSLDCLGKQSADVPKSSGNSV
jgi:hypothetical protein